MKFYLFFALFLGFSLSFFSQKYSIQLQFVYKQPYCGGAKPNAEMVAESEKDKPLDNHTFYVYRKNKCIDSLKTNENGIATVNYKAGTYCLVEAWKRFKKTPDGSPLKDYDKACLKKEWAKPNYKLTLTSDKDFKLELNQTVIKGICFYKYPCLLVRHMPQ